MKYSNTMCAQLNATGMPEKEADNDSEAIFVGNRTLFNQLNGRWEGLVCCRVDSSDELLHKESPAGASVSQRKKRQT